MRTKLAFGESFASLSRTWIAAFLRRCPHPSGFSVVSGLRVGITNPTLVTLTIGAVSGGQLVTTG